MKKLLELLVMREALCVNEIGGNNNLSLNALL